MSSFHDLESSKESLIQACRDHKHEYNQERCREGEEVLRKEQQGCDSLQPANLVDELTELKEQLASNRIDDKKDALKKVIALMTIDKDVSKLFIDIINCMQQGDIEMKKLVYLYLINYADQKPDLALLAVQSFIRDAADQNPLIRALAVRTMGCIHVEKISEYLTEPLRTCISDPDPYVRKTAAMCICKLYDISPTLVEEQGFIDSLHDMISDENSAVVANAVAALCEIQDNSPREVLKISTSMLQKLMVALNETSEWGQVYILDCLARYEPRDEREAEAIIERIQARLQHSNTAVVLSAIKVMMVYMEHISRQDSIRSLVRKMGPLW